MQYDIWKLCDCELMGPSVMVDQEECAPRQTGPPCGVKASLEMQNMHDDIIKWKLFPRSWPFLRGIHRSPVNSPYKGQWRTALMFFLICIRISGWVNNREAGDLRRCRAHYDVVVMDWQGYKWFSSPDRPTGLKESWIWLQVCMVMHHSILKDHTAH